MTRPTPRRSLLATSNPIAPAPEPTTGPVWDTAENGSAEILEEQHPVTPAAADPVTQQSKPKRTKISFFIDAEDAGRLRAALIERNAADKAAYTLTDFIGSAVMTEVERLEQELNQGKRFHQVAAGGIATGRPIGRSR